jgi:pSer/pThr/pTyr-binding forkhead associated (FHA) protein
VPALILQLTRIGFLILLCLFVLAAMRVVRSDLRYAADPRADGGTRSRGGVGQDQRQAAAGRLHPSILVVTAGSLSGTRLRLGPGPILIGRAEDSTLVLDDDYASTRHARLTQQGQEYFLEDLGSTNGTYLDRARVTTPTPVPIGVPIRIGRTVIELRP